MQHERARIEAADVYALIYPLWFNAPPAILKGYVDRVFSLGFGYDAELGGNRPLLAGKQLMDGGLQVKIAEKPGSALFVYKKVQ